MVTITWLQSAKNDLRNIFDFISIDSKTYAKYYVKYLKSRTDLLKDNPLLGRVVPELNKKEIREIIIDNYRIVYAIQSEHRITILMVHHTSRRFMQRWL